MPPESGTVFAKAPGHRGILRLASARDKVVPVQAMSPLIALAFERGRSAGEIFPFVEFEGQRPRLANRYVSYWEARQAFLRARRKIGDAFVVEYAFRKSLATLGLVGLGMMVHGTLEAALRFALDYQALAGAVLRLEMETHGDETAVVARDLYQDDELRQFWRLDHLVTVANVLRQLAGAEASPLRFEIEGELADDTRKILGKLLDCRIVDEADRSAIVYRRADLASPLRFPDPSAASIWRAAADRELAAIGRTGAQSLVEHLVDREGRLMRRREVSDKLGISERSLDRLLAREGVRFSKLAGLQRLEKAKSALSGGETVERAAERLGYSDARSFRRAFQKATGMSPAEFKAARKVAS